MYKLVQTIVNSDEKKVLGDFILELGKDHKRYFLRNEILQAFADYCHQFQKPAYFYHSSSCCPIISTIF
jgi:sucrose synthase